MTTVARTISLAAPLMSVHTIAGAATALNRLRIPDDHYILNVTYSLEEAKANCTGDTQLFITGTVSKQERPEDSCVRELQEEIMMHPKNGLKPLYGAVEHRGNRRTRDINWYSCKLTELEPFAPAAPVANNQRDSRGKVGCILHGTYLEALDLFSRIPVAEAAADGIVGVVGLRVGDVKKILELLPLHYSRHDHFYWCYNRGTDARPRPARDICAFSGTFIPTGSAGAIRLFIESMAPIASYAAIEGPVARSYCEVLECLASTAGGSPYCTAHQ
jgi:hypothetical protein